MAPSALERLEASRHTLKINIKLMDDKLKSNAVNPLTLAKVLKYLATTESIDVKLTENYERFIGNVDPADLTPHTDEYTKMYENTMEVLCGFEELKTQLTGAVATARTTSAPDIKLPRLSLPSFSGSLQDWSSFKDIFTSTIHNNVSISKAQKLTYLKTSLSGEPSRLIQNLSLTDTSYDIAWKQLSDRYQNDRELLFHILRRLFQQQSIQALSATSLRSLIDVTKECIRSLTALHRPVDQWDDVLLFFMFQKLDQTTRELWEQSLKDSSIPTFNDLLEFLESRARALAASTSTSTVHKPRQDGNPIKKVHHINNAGTESSCKVCSGDHPLYRCTTFTSMPAPERLDLVRKKALCFNCLRSGHVLGNCNSKSTCQKCHRRHHTLVHVDRVNGQAAQAPSTAIMHTSGVNGQAAQAPTTTIMHTSGDACVQQTLLATAVVNVQNPGNANQHQLVRAMKDGCSNSSFISEKCVQSLGLRRMRSNVEITGVGGVSLGRAKGVTTITISPYFNHMVKVTVTCFILPSISGTMPEERCDPSFWPHLRGLQLADPEFFEPAPVDLLLGADVFWYHLLDGRRSGPPEAPVGLRSTFGWLVAENLNSTSNRTHSHMTVVDLDRRLQQFWEIEAISDVRALTKEEKLCESHFDKTHSRDPTGRYTVKLPFKDPQPILGSSRDTAMRRLKQLERRLNLKPTTKDDYIKFMDEYLQLGHMEIVPDSQIYNKESYYIPHHFVLKASSSTTKLRVVFDASADTSTGVSLNDALLVGPTIQDSLIDLLTRFRLHPIAFTADLAKMYRQINVTPQDAEFQRILWRRSPQEPIQDYRLLTVTYGTASAPYLATRALQQLAKDERSLYPLGADVILNDMYVDDLMSGTQNVEDGINVSGQLLKLTNSGGHELRKWSSNSTEFLAAIPSELRETSTMLEMDSDQTVKALGVYWNTTQDVFQFKLTLDESPTTNLTKRKLLSQIAKVFDPLGWLAPAIIRAKILMQDVWRLQNNWDDVLPEDIQQQWVVFRNNLPNIEDIKLHRCMVPRGYHFVQLIGFCDASVKAYAAVVYLVADFDRGRVISLISSKTRVAPVKTISLPKLELCGALLLSQLMNQITRSLKCNINNSLAFTDSTIVRDWIQGSPSEWKTFVANRVTEIQERIPPACWHHVSGIDNPADCASRGVDPSELKDHHLWWQGPRWLRTGIFPETAEMTSDERTAADLERKAKTVVCNHVKYDNSLIHKFSNYHTLIRVTTWIIRFARNCHVRVQIKKATYPVNQESRGPLTPLELRQAELVWIRVVQDQSFHDEVLCLSKEKNLPPKCRILPLNPFVDSSGVLRVGGRLRNSPLPAAQKNPILLPRHHQYTKLLIRSEHVKNLHAGSQLLLSIITRKFWIVSAKDAIRHVIKQCVICTRQRGITQQQFMGDLPTFRVTPARPFLRCGIDYAGPFTLRAFPARSKVTFKSYLAIFVCFTTRAVHLDVVSSLTSEAFLATLRRFTSRRGKPSDIHSDCGTNFVGAAKEIKELTKFMNSTTLNTTISNEMSKDDITWHFNPAGAPHMGGLWEAGVKSVKFHLLRVVGSARLTFEQMTTTMSQIEACLNSRPLTPMSTDPNDLTALTPGHFLIGAPLTALPDEDFMDVNSGRLSQWQRVQQITQHFWKRWSGEFVTRMQQRPKWHNKTNTISINSLVLIKDERYPPLKWKLGRVVQLHPGPDGLTRVVTVKTAEGEIQRPLVKICLLPIDPATDPENEVLG